MCNPYYFNGGIAVHGLDVGADRTPRRTGAHGSRMDIAEYFPTLVTNGEAVYVVGTPKEPGDGYVGPAPTTAPTTDDHAPQDLDRRSRTEHDRAAPHDDDGAEADRRRRRTRRPRCRLRRRNRVGAGGYTSAAMPS